MQRGFYTAGSGMISNRIRMDVITNNLTNMDTIGYKKDHVLSRSFQDMLLERINDPSVLSRRSTVIGPHNLGLYIDELSTNFTQGAIEPTGQQTDFAIEGEGFFTVNTPNGMRYTRAGDFAVDHNGYLVTQQGYYVMDRNNNPIQVGFGEFSVKSDGTILVNGMATTQMALVNFNDVNGLRKQGDNLYYHINGEVPTQITTSTIRQGAIEGSNVDLANEAVEMITTNRAYEANQRAAMMIDSTLNKAANEIARF